MSITTPKSIFADINQKLEGHYETREAQNLTLWLLTHFYGIDRGILVLNRQFNNTTKTIQQVDKAIQRLLRDEPIQYVLGEAYFHDRKFKSDARALIPRVETEELVRLIIEENQQPHLRIVDIGTGTGCIAISLALILRFPEVFATDVSLEALALARENSRLHQAKVDFVHHDILQEDLSINALDIIVSNPPYIPHKDKVSMHRNVLDYEPEPALFVPDQQPLIFYEKIANIAQEKLASGGRLYFEIHEEFGDEMYALLSSWEFKNVRVIQDMQGKNRIVKAIKS